MSAMKRYGGLLLAMLVAAAEGTVPVLAQDAHRHPSAPPPAEASPPRLASASAVPALLAKGLAVVLFKAENIQLLPVYGEAALGVRPRLGHLHVTLDDQAWHWVHAGDDPVVVQGLPPGPHRLRLTLADANHRPLDTRLVEVTIPGEPSSR